MVESMGTRAAIYVRVNTEQLSLGHASFATTERYLGTRQDLHDVSGDGLDPDYCTRPGFDVDTALGGATFAESLRHIMAAPRDGWTLTGLARDSGRNRGTLARHAVRFGSGPFRFVRVVALGRPGRGNATRFAFDPAAFVAWLFRVARGAAKRARAAIVRQCHDALGALARYLAGDPGTDAPAHKRRRCVWRRFGSPVVRSFATRGPPAAGVAEVPA